ncbi:Retrovirus-related Pol polyprotein from transposon TNT 1-94 [Senna tora]|uniref:Retrovirus-related Pol polyprotein from transposon TNT 1-94 n=1 Tax=Senna tora TaxID=362788 RepID=A0A834SQS8_9FABA|nr:Retrovirus-related Pol polyprotein from transposon TNT 1-94 [Senna tora]
MAVFSEMIQKELQKFMKGKGAGEEKNTVLLPDGTEKEVKCIGEDPSNKENLTIGRVKKHLCILNKEEVAMLASCNSEISSSDCIMSCKTDEKGNFWHERLEHFYTMFDFYKDSGNLIKGSKTCIFMGYEPNCKGYKVYEINSGKLLVSRDVYFYEDKFPCKDEKEKCDSDMPFPIMSSDYSMLYAGDNDTQGSVIPPNSVPNADSLNSKQSNNTDNTSTGVKIIVQNLMTYILMRQKKQKQLHQLSKQWLFVMKGIIMWRFVEVIESVDNLLGSRITLLAM